MNLVISSEVAELMETRGVSEEDIKVVIENAEKNLTYLIDEDGGFLAKHRLGSFCPYVAYAKDGDNYEIKTVYAHKVMLGHELG